MFVCFVALEASALLVLSPMLKLKDSNTREDETAPQNMVTCMALLKSMLKSTQNQIKYMLMLNRQAARVSWGPFFLFFFFLLPLGKLTALSIKVNFKVILLKRCIKYYYQTPSASALYGGLECLLEVESTSNLTK